MCVCASLRACLMSMWFFFELVTTTAHHQPITRAYHSCLPAENLDDLVAFINGSDSKPKAKKKKKRKKKKSKRSKRSKDVRAGSVLQCGTDEQKGEASRLRDQRDDRTGSASAAPHTAAATAQQPTVAKAEKIPLADKSTILVKACVYVRRESTQARCSEQSAQ